MDIQQRMVQRRWILISEGYSVSTVLNQSNPPRITPQIKGMYIGWRLGSQSFFATVFNPGNVYREAFERIPADCPHEGFLPSELEQGLGILRAAQNEINYGAL